jgi:hypothetical protein
MAGRFYFLCFFFLDSGGGGTRPLPTCDRQPTRNGSIRQPEAEKSNWKIIILRKHSCGAVSLLSWSWSDATWQVRLSSQFLIQSRTSTSDFERELYRAPQWMSGLDFFLIVPHLNVTTWLNNQIIIKLTLGNKQSNSWATGSVLGLWFRFLIRPLKKLDAVANGDFPERVAITRTWRVGRSEEKKMSNELQKPMAIGFLCSATEMTRISFSRVWYEIIVRRAKETNGRGDVSDAASGYVTFHLQTSKTSTRIFQRRQ